MSLYLVNVTIHVLAAVLWLGGMFFLAVVGAPTLREVEPRLRAQLFQRLGIRFRAVGWICIAVLLATGVGNLYFRGMLRPTVGGAPSLWASPFGRTLEWKLAAVAAMIVVSALHDFVLGPAAGRAPAGTERARRQRSVATWLARVNAALGVIVVILAVRLSRGG